MGDKCDELRRDVYQTSSGTKFERLCGMMAISVFTSCYYFSTLYPVFVIFLLIIYGAQQFVYILAVPIVASIILPSIEMPSVLGSRFFKCALKYHDFELISEISDDEFKELSKTRTFIFACQPHGVISVAGICYGIHMAPERFPPTAVASVLLYLPIMKQVFGIYNLIDASRKSIVKTLKKQSVVLYIGGMAELFLSNPDEERLYIAKRKGFIKLAMQTGSDVIPTYFFGNTSTLQIIRGGPLETLSRTLGVSLTLFWGRWGLPISLPRKVLCVRGRPLGLPKIDNPTTEQVTLWHDKYLEEVVRLFNDYKEKVPDYKHKHLILDVDDERKVL